MKRLTTGSLCSGTGALDMAVTDVLSATPAWFCQYEPPNKDGKPDRWQFAARVLAHHWPDVPNHGDITAIDWDAVQKVDIITAGWPCTDVSLAGLMLGLVEGTRSGIWRHVAAAIAAQRAMRAPGEPGPIVFLENVRGLLSARADSDVEPCPWCLGDVAAKPPLRALGRVLGDLADLGFDAEWVGLPASRPDIGACHERWREFVLAWPAAHPPRVGWGEGRPGAEGLFRGSDAALSGHAAATDAAHDGHERGRDARGRRHGSTDRGHPAPDADGGRLTRHQERHLWPEDRVEAPRGNNAERRVLDWGDYEPAIRRWEKASGRPAPRPTQPGRNGPQLAPAFSEWMMGLPKAHVTGIPRPEGMSLPGYRNAQLKVIGGGVVRQQAAYALPILLARAGWQVAA